MSTHPIIPKPVDMAPSLRLKEIDDGKDIYSVLQDILVTLRKSTIIPREGETKWVRFWSKYQQEADEYDKEFLERYKSDMNNTMIFSGLLTSALATIAALTVSGLSQDPNLVTQTLLLNMLIVLNSTSGSMPHGFPVPMWDGPSVSIIWFQTLLYTSLVCSLMVALGAVLASQWLSRYSAVDERGTVEDRGKRRQQKFDGLAAWQFRAFLEALPILLQFSLLLFGISLCAFMWGQQRIIAAVLISANGLGGLLWMYSVIVSTIYSGSPYHTPLSDFLAQYIASKQSKKTSTELPSLPARFGFLRRRITNISSSISTPTLNIHRQLRSWWGDTHPRRPRTTVVHSPSRHQVIPHITIRPFHALVNAFHNYAYPMVIRVAEPIMRTCRAVLRVPHGVLSIVTTPIIRVHEKHLARSDPTANDAKRAAISWLLQTSTDPEIHTNALLVAHEVIWTDDMLSGWVSVKALDLIVKKLEACFHEDGHRSRAESADTIASLCASFLLIYWQLYRITPQSVCAWSHEFGDNHSVMVAALRDMDLDVYSHTSDNFWILHHTFYLFSHLKTIKAPRNMVTIYHLSAASLTHDATASQFPFTAKVGLQTLSLLSLAQVSYLNTWSANDCSALLGQIEDYCRVHRHTASAQYSLVAVALLLGFDEVASMDAGSLWAKAIIYLLSEMERHSQPAPSAEDSRLQIAYVFGIDLNDRRGVNSSRILSRITQALRSASQSLTDDTSPTLSSEFDLLTHLVPELSRLQEADPETVCHCAASAFHRLSRMAVISSYGHDRSLHTALVAASLIRSPSGDYVRNIVTFSAFIQMQSKALSLIYLLVQQGDFHATDIPTFSPDSCHWDLSHPYTSKVLDAIPAGERSLVEERDALFIKIVLSTSAGATDTRTRRAWLNDPGNDKLLRQWTHIAHRWSVPRHSYAHPESFAVRTLLECDRFRTPDVGHWGDDLGRIQQVLLVALWMSWVKRRDDATYGEPVRIGDLIDTTLSTMGMDIVHASDVEWYISDILEIVRYHLLHNSQDLALGDVRSVLEEKRSEVHQFNMQREFAQAIENILGPYLGGTEQNDGDLHSVGNGDQRGMVVVDDGDSDEETGDDHMPAVWLAEIVSSLCQSDQVDMTTMYHGVTGAIHILSHMDTPSRWRDGYSEARRTTLSIAAQVKPPPGDYLQNPSASRAFVQMQHAALSLILSLAENGIFHDTATIPTISPESCEWDLSQPREFHALAALSREERTLIEERDALVVKILRAGPAGAAYTPTRRSWLNDPTNDKLVCLWIYVAHRWLVPWRSFASSATRAETFSVKLVLDHEGLRYPEASHWGVGDLARVQQVTVVALWWSWVLRLRDVNTRARMGYGDLLESTQSILSMDTRSVAEVEPYIHETLSALRAYLQAPRTVQRTGALETPLVEVQSMLKRILAEIREFKIGDASHPEVQDAELGETERDEGGAVYRDNYV
ncbi:hypothetical protein BXZ70DRAFT_1027260 [Cristinia sonorae]|uniref:DUF6535 domain-containing protein n=1 Tax=Cristinia sonorae TaxID=1940300 RepID=A0A8K0XP38_9AGAR|nr:hypothetical protein BXZ70DRAFT_1027260 [Cristinia sonorae]